MRAEWNTSGDKIKYLKALIILTASYIIVTQRQRDRQRERERERERAYYRV